MTLAAVRHTGVGFETMPDRSRKRTNADPNLLAKAIVDTVAGEGPPEPPQKNAAAVELGRLGGLKGGKARAAKMSKEARSEAARKAVQARWQKHRETDS
jgi:hypothetical protein